MPRAANTVRAAATRDFIAACTDEPLDDATTAEFIAFNDRCPAHVRRALFRAVSQAAGGL